MKQTTTQLIALLALHLAALPAIGLTPIEDGILRNALDADGNNITDIGTLSGLGGNITLSGTIDGRDPSADGATLDALDGGLAALTSAEITQLQAIDSVTLSNAQWAFLGGLSSGEITSVTNIDAHTFTNADWAGLANLSSSQTAADLADYLQTSVASLQLTVWPGVSPDKDLTITGGGGSGVGDGGDLILLGGEDSGGGTDGALLLGTAQTSAVTISGSGGAAITIMGQAISETQWGYLAAMSGQPLEDFSSATDLDAAGALATDSVSANELDAAGVEAELEAVLDLADLQGQVGDGQVSDVLTLGAGSTITSASITSPTLTLVSSPSIGPTTEGIIGWDSDDDRIVVGDGVGTKTFYAGAHTVDTTLTQEQVEDYAGGMVSGNTETLIAVTYDDADGTLDFVVDQASLSITESQISDLTHATRASLGLDTTDTPQLAGIELGHATDTTITRVSAGVIAVEGVTVQTGTDDDVPEAGDFGAATSLDANGAIVANEVDDTMIDWGTGVGQVSADDLSDGVTNATPTLTQESNWDTAYGWGDHSGAGYLTSESDPGLQTLTSAEVDQLEAIDSTTFSTTEWARLGLFVDGFDVTLSDPEIQALGGNAFWLTTEDAPGGFPSGHIVLETGDSSLASGSLFIRAGSGDVSDGIVRVQGNVDFRTDFVEVNTRLKVEDSLDLKASASPAQTGEGYVEWDSDDDRLIVGTGAGQVTFYPGAHTVDTTLDLSGVETITGDWVNTANPWEDAEVADNITVTGSVAAATVVASGFSGNLTTADDTMQEIADAVDGLATGGGGATDTTTLWVDADDNDGSGTRGDPADPFDTVTNAIAAASSGDLIVVRAGTYANILTFSATGLTSLTIRLEEGAEIVTSAGDRTVTVSEAIDLTFAGNGRIENTASGWQTFYLTSGTVTMAGEFDLEAASNGNIFQNNGGTLNVGGYIEATVAGASADFIEHNSGTTAVTGYAHILGTFGYPIDSNGAGLSMRNARWSVPTETSTPTGSFDGGFTYVDSGESVSIYGDGARALEVDGDLLQVDADIQIAADGSVIFKSSTAPTVEIYGDIIHYQGGDAAAFEIVGYDNIASAGASGAGDVQIEGGSVTNAGSTGDAGSVVLLGGTAAGSGSDGRVIIQQPGGTPGTDELLVYHDGTDAFLENEDGAGEIKVIDGAANETTISPHVDDAPDALYIDPANRGLEYVYGSGNHYLGQMTWINVERLADVVEALSGRDDIIARETYAAYNARRSLSPGDPDHKATASWIDDQARKQARYERHRQEIIAARAAAQAEADALAARADLSDEEAEKLASLQDKLSSRLTVPPDQSIARPAPAWLTK